MNTGRDPLDASRPRIRSRILRAIKEARSIVALLFLLMPLAGYAQRYDQSLHGATPDDIWGTPEPHAIFIRPLCLTPSFYLYLSPCSIIDLGYLDEYSRFHFTRELTNRERRRIIHWLVNSGNIQIFD